MAGTVGASAVGGNATDVRGEDAALGLKDEKSTRLKVFGVESDRQSV